MEEIIKFYKKDGQLHHAYGLQGDRMFLKRSVIAWLEKDLKFPTKNNPDFWLGEYNVFKIADGRQMAAIHGNRPVCHGRKIFVLVANSITQDAQNSLLKVFEEPRADTIFFLILPSWSGLLLTLKSRLFLLSESELLSDNRLSKQRQNLDFLTADPRQRLEIVAKLQKELKEEKITKADIVDFIKGLETTLTSNRNQLTAENILLLEKAIAYANDESPSLRIILESLALMLPQRVK